MTRRRFLRRLVTAALGVALIRELPGIAPVPEPITEEPLGMAIRFIREFDIEQARHYSRLDVRYGAMMFQPDWAAPPGRTMPPTCSSLHWHGANYARSRRPPVPNTSSTSSATRRWSAAFRW